MSQDTAFGLRQLVDLATKALSPGINDPTTAVQAIDQIHDLLRQLATRPIPPGHTADREGVVRFVYPQMGWGDYVSLAFDEIRQYGAGSLQIHQRVRSSLEDLLTIAPPDRRAALRDQLRALAAAAERAFPDARDRVAAEHVDSEGIGS